MNREEKCILAIKNGYHYDKDNGKIYSSNNYELSSNNNNGYIRIHVKDYSNNKTYFLLGHHFAWYYTYKECVDNIDHINGIRNDNTISNLRSTTKQQNAFNRKTSNGYCWNKQRKKWKARIILNQKEIYLGSFNTEEEAKCAYLKAKEIYHIM